MQDNQLVLLHLDKLIVNSRFNNRGIIQSLSKCKLGRLVRKVKGNNVVVEDQNKKSGRESPTATQNYYQNQGSPITLIESNSTLFQVKQDNKSGLLLNLFNKIKPKSTKLSSAYTVDTPSLDSSLNDAQFAELKLSKDANSFIEIQQEIEQDIKEFVLCMKNVVFHRSDIHRFYIDELDNLRSKFFQLEDQKRIWSLYVFDYIKRRDGVVAIRNDGQL
jgi:hypothetical protein